MDFKNLFESVPAKYLILTPDLVIINASDSYLKAGLKKREDIIGKNIFDVFPENPDDLNADGITNLKASFKKVLESKLPHEMPIQKYDVELPKAEGGGFEERYWHPINTPVLDDKNEVVFFIHHVEDVTEIELLKKKSTEQNHNLLGLAENEEKYRLLVSGVKDYAIFMMDQNGIIQTWNKGANQIKGYEAEEIIGKHFSVFYPDEDKYKTDIELKIAREQGKYEEEGWRVKKDGSLIWCNVLISSIVNETGAVIGFSKVTRDLTERKKNEEALAHQRELYSSLLIAQSEMGEGVAIIEGSRFVFTNDALCKIYGYTSEELLAMPSFLEMLVPAEKERISERLSTRFTIGSSLSDHGEIEVVHKKGHTINIAYSLKMMPPFEKKQIFAIIRDITDQKSNEFIIQKKTKQLTEAQELAHIGSWDWDVLTNKIEWSDELYRIFGFNAGEIVSDFENYIKSIHPDDRELVNANIQKAFAEKHFFDFNHRIIRANGSVGVVSSKGNVYTDANGNVIRMAGTAQDITEMKEMAEYARSLIESSLDPRITLNTTGHITDINEAWIKITGTQREQMINRHIADFFTEPLKVTNLLKHIFKNGSATDVPLVVLHRNATATPVLYNAAIYKDKKGNVLGALTTAIIQVADDETEIEKYKPSFTEDERKDILAYNEISSKYSKIMNEELSEKLKLHPVWGGLIRQIPKSEQEKQNNISLALQNNAIINNDWPPYIHNLFQQGVQYAKMGVSFKDWVDIVRVVKNYLLPVFHNEYHGMSDKILSLINGMNLFIDAGMTIIGESYILELTRTTVSQKLATLKQKQLSEYSRSLIEASLDPLLTINEEGKISDVNLAAVKATGMSRENLLNTDFSVYFTEPEKARKGYMQVFQKGFTANFPLTLKHVTGKLTEVLFNASVYKDDKGNVAGVFAAARDITQIKKSEDKFKGLLESAPDAIVIMNDKGKILLINQRTEAVFGYTKKEITGKDVTVLIPQRYRTSLPLKKSKFLADPKVLNMGSGITLYGLHKSGLEFPVEINLSPYETDEGITITAAIRDITKQKEAEKELTEAKIIADYAREKAEESNKLKEAFLANMSHEIRTPMNAIMGFSDLLANGQLGEKEREYVHTINTAGKNLLTIINDILDISKIEAGMMVFEESSFSVREIFTLLDELLTGKAKEKKLELSFICDDYVPQFLSGDSVRLTQILINLAGNALKFTEEGKIEIHAHVLTTPPLSEKSNPEKVWVEFSVSDTGIGIATDKLEHIFERFRQAELQTTRKYGGTGIGLSLAKQLVELQGGTLQVKSRFNDQILSAGQTKDQVHTGSVFSFYIPFNATDKKPADTAQKHFAADLSGLSILLVEDNRMNIKLIKYLFGEYDLKLDVAENGEICLEKMREKQFDIILMDMEMPVMNGFEATVAIRNILKNDIPIIAMTAHAMAGQREKCLSYGMNDYISKPIDANLLFEKIYKHTAEKINK